MRMDAASFMRSSLSRRSRRRAMRLLFRNWEKRLSSTRRFCAGCSMRREDGLAGRDFPWPWQLDAHQEGSAFMQKLDIAAMAHDDIARNGEAQAGAAGFAVA